MGGFDSTKHTHHSYWGGNGANVSADYVGGEDGTI